MVHHMHLLIVVCTSAGQPAPTNHCVSTQAHSHHSSCHRAHPCHACSKQVAFPPRLKIKRSWLAPDSAERNVEYELVSTVVHHGKSISSGHYTADVRQPDDRWVHGQGGRGGRGWVRAAVDGAWAGRDSPPPPPRMHIIEPAPSPVGGP